MSIDHEFLVLAAEYWQSAQFKQMIEAIAYDQTTQNIEHMRMAVTNGDLTEAALAAGQMEAWNRLPHIFNTYAAKVRAEAGR